MVTFLFAITLARSPQAVTAIFVFHDPVRHIAESKLLAAERPLAEGGAQEADRVFAVEHDVAEAPVLAAAVIDEKLSPMLFSDVRIVELQKKRIDLFEVLRARVANAHHLICPCLALRGGRPIRRCGRCPAVKHTVPHRQAG
jgi:hypothetical protein